MPYFKLKIYRIQEHKSYVLSSHHFFTIQHAKKNFADYLQSRLTFYKFSPDIILFFLVFREDEGSIYFFDFFGNINMDGLARDVQKDARSSYHIRRRTSDRRMFFALSEIAIAVGSWLAILTIVAAILIKKRNLVSSTCTPSSPCASKSKGNGTSPIYLQLKGFGWKDNSCYMDSSMIALLYSCDEKYLRHIFSGSDELSSEVMNLCNYIWGHTTTEQKTLKTLKHCPGLRNFDNAQMGTAFEFLLKIFELCNWPVMKVIFHEMKTGADMVIEQSIFIGSLTGVKPFNATNEIVYGVQDGNGFYYFQDPPPYLIIDPTRYTSNSSNIGRDEILMHNISVSKVLRPKNNYQRNAPLYTIRAMVLFHNSHYVTIFKHFGDWILYDDLKASHKRFTKLNITDDDNFLRLDLSTYMFSIESHTVLYFYGSHQI